MSDMLVTSAHFDGGNYFFADRPDADEYLKVEELERISLSECSQGDAQLLKRGIPVPERWARIRGWATISLYL